MLGLLGSLKCVKGFLGEYLFGRVCRSLLSVQTPLWSVYRALLSVQTPLLSVYRALLIVYWSILSYIGLF